MIYLDNAATTKPCEEALNVFCETNTTNYFNPSAAYSVSFQLSKDLNEVRSNFIGFLGGEEGDKFIFTSGATESNNMAILGTCTNKQKTYLFSSGEHPSVYNCALELKNKGYQVDFIPLQKSGEIDYDAFDQMCDENTCFVSTMLVNNETGAINDLKRIKNIILKNSQHCLFHVDAVQGFGKIRFSAKDAGIDLCSISSHKICGIKGVGGLYVSKDVHIKNINFGGNQENGLRSGTVNAAAILSFNKATQIAMEDLDKNYRTVQTLKNYLVSKLEENALNVRVVSNENCSPYIVSLIFENTRGETLMRYLDSKQIYIGTGSACSSNKVGNRILESMGYQKNQVIGAVRISFCKDNNTSEIDCLIDNILTYKQTISV